MPLRTALATVALGMVLITAAAPLAAQPLAPTPRTLEAARHAPALWLAGDEPFYPTLPHPFAFDGIDNDRDGCYDLADPTETGALANPSLNTNAGRSAHLAALRTLFDRLRQIRSCLDEGGDTRTCAERFEPESTAPAPASCSADVPLRDFQVCGALWGQPGQWRCGPDVVVIHGDRLPDSGDRQAAWSFARADPSAGARRAGAAAATLRALQYWMFYPWDAGHINDGEHITVFYWDPENPGARNVKAVVGAGHDTHTPNNVLVADWRGAGSIPPRTLPRHLPFLVELGKHASAPDANCNGVFNVGVDANVGALGTWGTRDVMVSNDMTPLGPFREWMSEERDGSGFFIAEGAEGDAEAWRHSCGEFTRGREIVSALLEGRHAGRTEVAGASHRYRLLDYRTMKRLYEQTDVDSALAWARDHAAALWGSRAPTSLSMCATAAPGSGCVSADGYQAIRAWSSVPSNRTDRERRDVWRHGAFGRPMEDFKTHLFPIVSAGAGALMAGGNRRAGAVVRTGGFRPLKDSSIDVGVYLDGLWFGAARNKPGCNPCVSDVSLTLNFFRTSYRGFYGGFAYSWGTVDQREVSLTGADGTTPVVLREDAGGAVSAFAGVAWSLQKSPASARVTVRIGVQGPVHEGNTKDRHEYSARSYAQLQASVDVLWAVYRGRHPLAR